MTIKNSTGEPRDTRVFLDNGEDITESLRLERVTMDITPDNLVSATLHTLKPFCDVKIDDTRVTFTSAPLQEAIDLLEDGHPIVALATLRRALDATK